jgi:transposase
MAACFVGIDISKGELVVAIRPSGEQWTTTNDEVGWTNLTQRLQALQPQCIVFEATGGLEAGLGLALATAELPLALVNPRKVRDYAKSVGQLAKTDRLDATVLARYAEHGEPLLTVWRSEEVQSLQDTLSRRRQLVAMRSVERERRVKVPARLQPGLDRHLTMLTEEIKACDTALLEVIKANPTWRAKYHRMRTVPGVGLLCAATMLVFFTMMGHNTREQVASLVGVAPFNRDSGLYRGTRRIEGGRTEVRRILYMAAIAATRFNPTIHDFYVRLLAINKPPKVAIIACARKLSHILRAIYLSDTEWRVPSSGS